MWSNAQSIGGPLMRTSNTVLASLIILFIWVQAQGIRAQTTQQYKRIVIEGSKIVAIDPKAGPVDYDLRGLTLMPGWIDAHVHITWSFGKDGKNAGPGETTQDAAYRAAANAWVTLMAGFTTVQSVGSPNDVPLRDVIAKGSLPGPRILTANQALAGQGERSGTPDEIRAFIRKQKEAGADLIKIFAAQSIRQGGGMTF